MVYFGRRKLDSLRTIHNSLSYVCHKGLLLKSHYVYAKSKPNAITFFKELNMKKIRTYHQNISVIGVNLDSSTLDLPRGRCTYYVREHPDSTYGFGLPISIAISRPCKKKR